MTHPTMAIGVLLLAAGATSIVQAGVNDGNGKEWMQLPTTVGLSWTQTAQVCPQDGLNACVGAVAGRNLIDWVWATDSQVLQLWSYFDPALLTSRAVEGLAYFGSAQSFLSAFQPTQSSCITYSCGAFGSGWTASRDDAGSPIFGSVGWNTTPVSASGGFGVGPAANADEAQNGRGVWLWRDTGPGVYAYDDAGQVISPAGGIAIASVLANDTLNGVPVTTAIVRLSQVSPPIPGITLNVATGAVSIASKTTSGTYTLVYRICEIASPTNCDDATITLNLSGRSR